MTGQAKVQVVLLHMEPDVGGLLGGVAAHCALVPPLAILIDPFLCPRVNQRVYLYKKEPTFKSTTLYLDRA